MFDPRVQQVDAALGALAGEAEAQAALWDWACREMLHETQAGMHQLSCVAGIAESVADAWRAPVDVIEPARPFLPRAVFADARLPQVLDGLDGTDDSGSRATLWRARYAAMIAATLQGMRALAGKHRIPTDAPVS